MISLKKIEINLICLSEKILFNIYIYIYIYKPVYSYDKYKCSLIYRYVDLHEEVLFDLEGQ